jgi:hypothetical protein
LRPFQAAHGEQAIAWLGRRRGWRGFDLVEAHRYT